MIEISPSQSFVYSLCCSLLSLTANVLDIPRFLSALASDNARQWGRRTRAIAFPISSMTIKVPILFSQSPVLDLACVTMLSAVGKNSFWCLFFFFERPFLFFSFGFPICPFHYTEWVLPRVYLRYVHAWAVLIIHSRAPTPTHDHTSSARWALHKYFLFLSVIFLLLLLRSVDLSLFGCLSVIVTPSVSLYVFSSYLSISVFLYLCMTTRFALSYLLIFFYLLLLKFLQTIINDIYCYQIGSIDNRKQNKGNVSSWMQVVYIEDTKEIWCHSWFSPKITHYKTLVGIFLCLLLLFVYLLWYPTDFVFDNNMDLFWGW